MNSIHGSVNNDNTFKETFLSLAGWHFTLIKSCIYIAVAQQKWIKMHKNEDAYSWK